MDFRVILIDRFLSASVNASMIATAWFIVTTRTALWNNAMIKPCCVVPVLVIQFSFGFLLIRLILAPPQHCNVKGSLRYVY